jgi:Uma2 family endonuclease
MTHLIPLMPLLFEPGDRLSREEFLELWERMPNLKFAELIDGVVYMPSPVSYEHSRRDVQMQLVLATYAARTGVCEALSNATWLMLASAPQPDLVLRLRPEYGGKTEISRNLASGSPEFLVEVTRSSRSIDLGPKLALYEQAGVTEYIAVPIKERRLERRFLEAGRYRILEPDTDGVFRSRVFPGLWLDQDAFWQDDAQRLLAVLDQGLASEECRSFLDRLRNVR